MTEDTAAESIGARVRRLRLARGLSQSAIAGPGVSGSYISRIERGGRAPTPRALRTLAGKLGVDPEYLESGDAIPATKERELRLADAELTLRLGDDLDRAEELLRQLLDEQVPDGIEARVRATLGGIAARRGDHDEAIRQLETVIASGAVHPCTRPDVYETLSHSYLATGSPVLAIKLLEGAIGAADAEERYVTQQVRFRTFLATALSSVGANARAQRALDKAMQRAEALAQPEVRIGVAWEKGRVAWNQGRSDEALHAINYARALAELTDDSVVIARSHVLAATLHNCEGRPGEAREHLERAEQILAGNDDAVDLGLLRVEQARVEAELGDPHQALALAREADELLREHVRHRANGWHALALALAAVGELDAAVEQSERAIAEMLDRGQWRQALVVARDEAAALRVAGREADAYAVLERSTGFSRHETEMVEPQPRPS